MTSVCGSVVQVWVKIEIQVVTASKRGSIKLNYHNMEGKARSYGHQVCEQHGALGELLVTRPK